MSQRLTRRIWKRSGNTALSTTSTGLTRVAGNFFCLAHAPSAEAAACVHREAHGLLAEKIIEVEPDVAEVFLGGTETNNVGAVLLPGGGADARD